MWDNDDVIVTLIGAVFGTGGLCALVAKVYLIRLKAKREAQLDAQQWISQEYQKLIQLRADEIAEKKEALKAMDRKMQRLEDKLSDAYAQIVKLGGTWPMDD